MATIVVIILLLLGIGIFLRIYVCIISRRTLIRSSLNEMTTNNIAIDRGSLGSTSMSRNDIEKLPCFDFKAKDEEQKGTSPPPNCAVCLENFCSGEKCRLLPSCKHSFHAECVDLWLSRASFCPICRAEADTTRSGSLCGGDSNRFMSENVVGNDQQRGGGGGGEEEEEQQQQQQPANGVEVVVIILRDDINVEYPRLNNIDDLGFSKSHEMDSASVTTDQMAVDVEDV